MIIINKLSIKLRKNQIHILISYLLIGVILLNSILNVLKGKNFNTIEVNYFDLIAGLFLFAFLISIGILIKDNLKFESISIAIVCYLFSFFVLDCFILFFFKEFKFLEIFLIVNVLWIFLILSRSKKIIELFPPLISITILKVFTSSFQSKFTINKNLIGDVNAVFFDQAKTIYENSYYFSINNFVFEGYPQFISYIQSLFLVMSSNLVTYNFYAYTSHIVFYLSLLFFTELNITKFNKFILISLFSLLIFNSHFLKFLFTTSLMSEGLVNLFTAITTISVLNNIDKFRNLDSKLFFIFGFMYFSKQFNSSLVLILLFILLIYTKFNKTILFGFIGLITKELLYIFVFPEVDKDHHIKQMDVVDTIFDLFLLRDLKIENFILILKNLWIDKPIVILFFIFYFLNIFSKVLNTRFEIMSDIIFFKINLNIVFVFLLYISVWRNMELESPIRYFLNYFHLIIISIFYKLEKK